MINQSALRHAWRRRRNLLSTALYWTGIGLFYEVAVRPTGGIVLMYHSVAKNDMAEFIDPPNRLSPAIFEQQMSFLSKYRKVISLSKMAEKILAGETLGAGCVAITFDDGYLDNFHVAAPILGKYHLPATLFLATGYVQRAEAQWVDLLYWLLESHTRNVLHLPQTGCLHLNLSVQNEKYLAKKMVHRYLLEATYENRSLLLHEIKEQLKPISPLPPRLTMNWNEVRELVRKYPIIEIGGHTRNHIDLKSHDSALAYQEIAGCCADIEKELGDKPKLFSFPYGRWNEKSRRIVTESGWVCAAGANRMVRVDAGGDLYSIERVDAPRTMTDFRFKTSGSYPGILSALGVGRFS